MISMYEYWIEAKIIEAERSWPARRDAAVHGMTREVLA
jgi:hypothetical protein